VAKTLGHIADPSRGDSANAAGADELIEQRIRDRPDELELAPPLPDHLVPRRKRNERFEGGAERDSRAVGHEAFDRLGHRHHLAGHGWRGGQRPSVSM